MMFPTMTQTGKALSEFLKKTTAKTETSVLDMRDISARFTVNMIASIAFGIEVNALENPNSDFRVYGKRVFEPTVIQVLMNMFAFLFPKLGKLFKVSIRLCFRPFFALHWKPKRLRQPVMFTLLCLA